MKENNRQRAMEKLILLSEIYPEFDFVMFEKDVKLLDVLKGYRWK